jgi:hypothetical protein
LGLDQRLIEELSLHLEHLKHELQNARQVRRHTGAGWRDRLRFVDTA